jgi:hypothetical protein
MPERRGSIPGLTLACAGMTLLILNAARYLAGWDFGPQGADGHRGGSCCHGRGDDASRPRRVVVTPWTVGAEMARAQR